MPRTAWSRVVLCSVLCRQNNCSGNLRFERLHRTLKSPIRQACIKRTKKTSARPRVSKKLRASSGEKTRSCRHTSRQGLPSLPVRSLNPENAFGLEPLDSEKMTIEWIEWIEWCFRPGIVAEFNGMGPINNALIFVCSSIVNEMHLYLALHLVS